MTSLTNTQIGAIIFYNFRRGLRTDERWYKQSERGDFNFEDDPHLDRPRDVTPPETAAFWQHTVKKLVIRENRRITHKRIEETLKISDAWTVNKIFHEHLHLRNVCTLFVPHKLTDEQRANRVEWCKRMLL